MALTIYGEHELARKTPDKLMPTSVHPEIANHDLVTPDLQVAVLSLLDEAGSATLGDCVAAIPRHASPVAAIVAMAELGLISFDTTAAFDQHLTVRRRAR